MQFHEIVADVVTAHENGTYRPSVNPAADAIVKAMKSFGGGKWTVLAAGGLFTSFPDDFDPIPGEGIGEFLMEHLQYSGSTIGETLKNYAHHLAQEYGGNSELGRLFEALDKAGMVDFADWKGYADSGMTPVKDLRFVAMPVPAGEAGVFLFEV